MIKAKLYAIGAAFVAGLLVVIKVLTLQKKAAQEDARRAKKHMTEVKEIRKVEKVIKAETKEDNKRAIEKIKKGEMPDNIRSRNDF